jgi:hypothetical protein
VTCRCLAPAYRALLVEICLCMTLSCKAFLLGRKDASIPSFVLGVSFRTYLPVRIFRLAAEWATCHLCAGRRFQIVSRGITWKSVGSVLPRTRHDMIGHQRLGKSKGVGGRSSGQAHFSRCVCTHYRARKPHWWICRISWRSWSVHKTCDTISSLPSAGFLRICSGSISCGLTG